MHFKRKTYLLLVLLFACFSGMGQMATSFSFSSISNANNSSMGISTPILIEGKTKCLAVSNGIDVLTIANNGTGLFEASCKELPPVNPVAIDLALSLTVYPNPTRGMSVLKCRGTFDAGLSCMIRVVSMEGKVAVNQLVPMTSMLTGWVIDLSDYTSGTYTVHVELMRRQYSLKLIRL